MSDHETSAHPVDDDVKSAVREAKKRFDFGNIKIFSTRFAAAVKHHPWWAAMVVVASAGACKLCVYFAATILAAGLICATLAKEENELP